MTQKRFISALSTKPSWKEACEDISSQINRGLGKRSCDFLIFFVSAYYEGLPPDSMPKLLKNLVRANVAIGCNASGVIGDRVEIQAQPAISALAMHLPGVKTFPSVIEPAQLSKTASVAQWIEKMDVYPTERPKFICLVDPTSCDVIKLLDLFNESYPQSPVIGGVSSSNILRMPGWFSLNEQVISKGAVAVALSGDISFDIAVSQGCRPFGGSHAITKATNNIVHELSGRPAIEVLQEELISASDRDRKLAREALYIGLVIKENQATYTKGDFLIRSILGADNISGAIAIGAIPKPGQTLQFQLKESRVATQDLRRNLLLLKRQSPSGPEGALLVDCCGRGLNLYNNPHHDISLIQSLRGPLPLAGFFANGEIGPLNQKNYVHGFTASLTIIR